VEEVLSKYILTLYVTGTSPRTKVAIDNLNRICEQELEGRYELEIVDVLEHPQRAEDEKILATPTLIKQLPLPLRRVIGDLSDKEKVLLGLEVRPNGDSSSSSTSTARREAS
jgi:circadian clock protein KaiB